ncbi:hypothetical protein EDD80_102267 [Anseongella ginsenosidimutans]|uniref:Uncharacterized protein n=2 Tax=Anseongella ginsenosidimutans TaxID=496056 RepID=A0A4R3KVU5_9SPHI|nr:hypothetical protein EDD80_102267 [Anseongella ginsenosidimutans]
MAFDEREYIEVCKRQIEKKFAFGSGNGYTQRDLESLAVYIEENTAVNLSLSTLKRLWKGNFKERPQVETLNALAKVLDYKDWQDFKMRNPLQAQEHPGRFTNRRRAVFIMAALIVLIVTSLITMNMMEIGTNSKNSAMSQSLQVKGPVHFSTQKTVTSGIPNTVIFNYDLSQVDADSFFIQQTWNDFYKAAIDPEGHYYTSIYYESGYHRARLIANDSVIALQPVHILSDGWEPHLYYSYKEEPVDFKDEAFIQDGYLLFTKALLRKRNVDLSRDFFTRISNSRKFNVSSGDFSLVSRMKVDSMTNRLCPWMQVMVVTEKHVFWVNLQNKGCERNASYKMGEIVRSGENNNLSALGVVPYEWQDVDITVESNLAKISLNGEIVFRETFKEDFGEIMGLVYLFEGTGSLDYVRLTDGDGQTAFEDDFSLEDQQLP